MKQKARRLSRDFSSTDPESPHIDSFCEELYHPRPSSPDAGPDTVHPGAVEHPHFSPYATEVADTVGAGEKVEDIKVTIPVGGWGRTPIILRPR